MAERPEGESCSTIEDRRSILALYTIRGKTARGSHLIRFPLRLTGYTPEKLLLACTGGDQLGRYADTPIALRTIFTNLPVEIFWNDPPLSLHISTLA